MTSFLRRAGSARLPDGASLVWTLAEGDRGRRWRAFAMVSGSITHALLLEVDRAGRPARLELTTPAGLLTLHPHSDGSLLHGNVVGPHGVRHLALAWSPAHALSIDGRPLANAVTAHRLADSVGVGEGHPIQMVAIAPDLSIREEIARFERVDVGTWRITGPSGERTMTIDPRGIPLDLADAREWPLELD